MEPPDAAVLDVAKLARSMGKELEDFDRRRLKQWRRPTIHRVFPRLREEDSSAYNPKVISIGPFHRDNEALRAMEVYKWRYLHDLLARSPVNKLERCIAGVSKRVEEIRAQYSEEFENITDEDFVKMMVLDGCFILELLIKSLKDEEAGLSSTTLCVQVYLWIDLLLLENQIPYFVLETLFDALAPRPPIGNTLLELVLKTFWDEDFQSLLVGSTVSLTPILHLLHLTHSFYLLQPHQDEPFSCWEETRHKLRKIRKVVSYVSYLVLSCVMCSWPGCSTDEESINLEEMIPCATRLKEAGIRFQVKKRIDKGKFGFLTRVSFTDGALEMPPMYVGDLSNNLLRNWIAFEQCSPDHVKCFYTSFAYFMDRLIDTEDDVALLEDAGIVSNAQGSSQEAASFFNRLYKGAIFDIQDHYFADLFKDVNMYRKSDHHGWRARLVRDYFSNPWSVISIAAAAVLLALTIVQTIYTVKSYYSSSD